MFKNLRRYYWLTAEFIKRHHRLMVRTVLGVMIFSGVLIAIIRYVPSPRHITRIGLVGKYTQETLPQNIQSKVSEGLVHMDQDGNPKSALADTWDVKDEGLTYVFHLDPDKRWHDGTRIKPEDISYNFKEVTVERGEDTITYKLPDPFSPFFYAVDKPILKDGKYGTSQYSITNTVVFSGVVQSVTLLSETDKLIYKFYPTETSALTAFKLGEVDRLDNLSFVPNEVLDDNNIETNDDNRNQKIAVLFFNNNDQILTSKAARQGLAYAIKDKSFGHTRAISPIPESSWAYNPLVKDYQFDPERAKTLFSQDLESTNNLKLELKTTLQYLDVAESIADDWRENLGIEVDVKVVTGITNDYQAILADFAPPADPDQYTIWHSTQIGNFTHYTNLKVDKLIEDGRRTSDRKLRKDIYQDFQRFLLEDCPAVFLFNTSSYTISHKSLFN